MSIRVVISILGLIMWLGVFATCYYATHCQQADFSHGPSVRPTHGCLRQNP